MHTTQKIAAKAIAALLCLSTAAHAQESANTELDACVKEEQIMLTAKGAGAGVLAGLGAALFSNNKKDALKNAAIGAVVGGAAGFATAYFTAVDTCFKKNPAWIPESKIERTKAYAQVKKDTKYKPTEGIKAQATKIEMPTTIKAGVPMDIVSTFIVLTPNGAETPIVIERKLFAIVEGKETALTFTGRNSEERTVEPGEHQDTARLPIPSDAKADTQYRFEFSVSAGGKPVSTVKETVTVQ
ncbi:hypothetical protein ETQ85_01155 [Zoogloea oleivorans]|jgi:hypothetical protein|uniref:Glycine zipper domain-containing protein n=2 Tax=Zoogloea TaxID=349 RepID=A0A6C2D6Q0_9RHOO|nr:hypothetical protein [Zoogloea oleivorans]TYC62190.1 hypothetical protein ETQ85_01155 [Zoogloea oleivorans]